MQYNTTHEIYNNTYISHPSSDYSSERIHTLSTPPSIPPKNPLPPSGGHKRRDLPALINNPHRPLHDVGLIDLQCRLRQSSPAPREVKSDPAPDTHPSDGAGRPLLRQGRQKRDSKRHIEARHIWRLNQSVLLHLFQHLT